MIFVTVGNARNPFQRLVDAADRMAARLDEEVVVQSGHTPYRAAHARQVPFLELTEFQNLVEQARLVVAHAGCGSIASAIRCGKPLIVMPRRKQFGEHVNDHQLELAEALAQDGRLRKVDTFEELWDAVQAPPVPAARPTAPSRLQTILDRWLDLWITTGRIPSPHDLADVAGDQVPAATPFAAAAAPAAHQAWVDLSAYRNAQYDPGRGRLVRTLWYFLSLLLFESGWFPLSRPKAWLLRLFGARIGRRLVIKPHVRIKYPWRLTAGDHCWIGQEAWIDNLADVRLGSHVCISQKAYLCTGSHDHRRSGFDLITRPIDVADGAWLGAACVVLGGTHVGANAVVGAGAVVTGDVAPAAIVVGNPARPLDRPRTPPAPEDASP